MKKFDVSMMWATAGMLEGWEPWNGIRDSDAIQDYVRAETPEDAISLALQYLFDNSDGEREINEADQTITFYDESGNVKEQAYAFEAEEVVEYYNKYGDYNVMTREDFDFWKEDEPEFMSGITII